jgi:hypothetical protein
MAIRIFGERTNYKRTSLAIAAQRSSFAQDHIRYRRAVLVSAVLARFLHKDSFFVPNFFEKRIKNFRFRMFKFLASLAALVINSNRGKIT